MIKDLFKFGTIVTFLLLITVSVSLGAAPRVIDGIVSKVSDGDTIQVIDQYGNKVKSRLYGIDAPETAKPDKPGQPFGEEATSCLRNKVLRKPIKLFVVSTDRYGRLVSLVRLQDRDINREMVEEGWAWAYKQYLSGPYASAYMQSEEIARTSRKGLWRQNNPQPPWEFRSQLRNKL